MVGFADQAHFSKQFKQKEGMPPSAWKKGHRAKSEKELIFYTLSKNTQLYTNRQADTQYLRLDLHNQIKSDK